MLPICQLFFHEVVVKITATKDGFGQGQIIFLIVLVSFPFYVFTIFAVNSKTPPSSSSQRQSTKNAGRKKVPPRMVWPFWSQRYYVAPVASEVSLDQKPMMKASRPKAGQPTAGRTVGGTVFDGRGLDR